MAKFHTLTIADVKHETVDCVSLAFSVPQALTEEYKYIQGQYLTLKINVDGEELRRSYSICSSTITDKDLRVAIKKVKGGKVSTWINDQAKIGASVEVMTPLGKFYTELKPTNKKNYVLFAGGSGITPMMSIIKTTLSVEEKSQITLFYGNFNEDSIIFKTELNELEKKFSGRLKVYHVLDKPFKEPSHQLLQGMMLAEKINSLLQNFVERTPVTEYFICGPGPMMENVKQALETLNVHPNYIHIEYFTAALSAIAAAEAASETKPDLASKVIVIMD
ncbi:MAG: FAD-binding oxidoreductase, partial [Bacteroidia bacterium]